LSDLETRNTRVNIWSRSTCAVTAAFKKVGSLPSRDIEQAQLPLVGRVALAPVAWK